MCKVVIFGCDWSPRWLVDFVLAFILEFRDFYHACQASDEMHEELLSVFGPIDLCEKVQSIVYCKWREWIAFGQENSLNSC